jgi:hypothetical protein
MKIPILPLACAIAMTAMPALAVPLPAGLGHRATTPQDRDAIAAVLDRYAHCVSVGDEAGFRALLIDDDIPFSTIPTEGAASDASTAGLRRYAGFRDAVFRAGRHYRQTFHHVRIEQDGALAQASLDFVTRRDGGGSFGWKVLQLVKTADGWKIASEFFTVRDLP